MHEHRQAEQAEIDRILSETFATDYCDQQIGHLLSTHEHANKYHSSFRKSSAASNGSHSSQNHENAFKQSFGSEDENGLWKQIEDDGYMSEGYGEKEYKLQQSSYVDDEIQGSRLIKDDYRMEEREEIDEDYVEKRLTNNVSGGMKNIQSVQQKQIKRKRQQSDPPEIYQKLFEKQQKIYKKWEKSQIKEIYPEFIISQPTYTVQKAHQQHIFKYNTLLQVNIQTMDIGYCTIAEQFRVVIGTDDSRVAIFDHTYTKPVNIFEAFPPGRRVMTVKWSKNLQYLIVTSDKKQLRVYQFKQTITIQQRSVLRMRKTPIELFSLSAQKQLKNSIISAEFIDEDPFMVILIDESDEMLVLQYKKHFINMRPYLSQLDLKFNDVFMVASQDFVIGGNQNRKQEKSNIFNTGDSFISNSIRKMDMEKRGTLLAVCSAQYVTICLLKPHFEVIMVYDKDKHGKNIRKQGYSHISFRTDPLSLLIVWDKFAHIINIEIQQFQPLEHRISSAGMQLLPQSTLLAGFISNTLIYHVSQSGIKIYPTSGFSSQKQLTTFRKSIYQYPINFTQLPSGYIIQQQLLHVLPPLNILRLLSSLVIARNGRLFMTSNTSLFSVKIEQFSQYIRNTIQHYNNWKVGLQLLIDAYDKKYTNYDDMTQTTIVKLIKEYSLKYIKFLQVVIGSEVNQNNSSLWAQQILFVLNILIEAKQEVFIFDVLMIKMEQYGLGCLSINLAPFILQHRVRVITEQGLQILCRQMTNPKKLSLKNNFDLDLLSQKQDFRLIISVLLVNLDPQLNEQDLPHTLNRILLKYQFYHQLVLINNLFKDYYTGFAVLVGKSMEKSNLLDSYTKKNQKCVNIKRPLEVDETIYQEQKPIIQQPTLVEKNSLNSQQQQEPAIIDVVEQKQNIEKLCNLISFSCYQIINQINSDFCQQYLTKSEEKKQLLRYKTFLQIFLPLFQTSIIPILLTHKSQQKVLFSHLIPNLYKGRCLQLINDISNKILNADIMTDIVMGIPVSDVHDLQGYWKCLIRLYNKSVIKTDIFMGLKYLATLKNPSRDMFSQQQSSINTTIDMQQIEQFIQHTVQTSYGKISEQLSKLSKQTLQDFYEAIIQSEHVGVIEIVGKILGEGKYIPVTHCIISSPHHREQMLYTYLFQIADKLSSSEHQKLRNIICQNLQLFIQLNCQKLCDFLITYFIYQIPKILANPMDRQNNNVNEFILIGLISKLLQKLTKNKDIDFHKKQLRQYDPCGQFMLSLRLRYLQLLAITGRQQQILQQIRKQNYPLDESLKICRKFGVIDAQAYLLVKSGGEGEVSSAILLYFKLIGEKTLSLTPEIIHSSFKEYLISIVKECIRVCTNLHNSPEHFSQEWFIISTQLGKLKQNVYSRIPAYTSDLLSDAVDKQVYPILAQAMVQNTQLQTIVQALQEQIGIMDITFLRILLHQILKNHAFQRVMFLLTQQTFIDWQLRERQLILNKAIKGYRCATFCDICHQTGGLIIHYNSCHHQVHPSCGQDVKNCVICTSTLNRMIERQIDGSKKVKAEIYGAEIELITQQESRKNFMQKMWEFENMSASNIDYLI